MVVADADKDNMVGTFALRTYAFSYNKWPNKAPDYFRTVDGEVDTQKCSLHIYDQAWERFRNPYDYGSAEEKQQQIPENILHYKTLGKIKGVVHGEENIQAFLKEHPDATVKHIPEGDYKESAGTPYIIVQEKGDDVYSQIDKEFGSNGVMKMRDGFLQNIQHYVNAAEHPEMEAQVPNNMKLSTRNSVPLPKETHQPGFPAGAHVIDI